MSDVPFPFGGVHSAAHHNHQQQPAPMLNGTPVSAQAQQPPAMPMAALPPQLMAALQGIAPEQLGAIFQAFQSGLIPMPPANLAPAQPAPAPPAIDPSLPIHTVGSSHAPGAVVVSNVDVNMDQEDGEIEDGEVDDASTLHTRGFLRTPPKGPRDGNSRRGSHQFQQHAQQATRPGLTSRASSSTLPKAMIPNGKVSIAHANAPSRPSKEAASKAFIREMYQAGYSYDDLLREVKDAKMLRRMYEQLSLPLFSPSSTKAAPSPVDTVRKQIPTKSAKSPAAPPKDRSEYLAKLQAAKAKKTEATKGSTNASAVTQPVQPAVTPPSQGQTNVPAAPLKAAVIVPSVATQPVAKAHTPMSKEKTDELRRRLEAIKAKRAAEQHAKLSSDTAQQSSPANRSATGDSTPQQTVPQQNTGLGAGLIEAVAKATNTQADGSAPVDVPTAQAVNTSFAMPSSGTASPLLNRGFSLPGLSLPGLFTSYAPQPAPLTSSPRLPANGSSSYAIPPGSSKGGFGAGPGRKAPLASQNAVSGAHHSTDGAPPQLGQRNNARASEQCVIEVSSDEEDDMDTDDSSEEEHVPSPALGREVAKQLTGTQNGVSAPATPDPYKRKMEEIEQFKQQIAEKEKRRKLANLQGVRLDATHDATGMTTAVHSGDAAADAAPSDVASMVPSSAAVAATRLARAQEKEALQRRLRELEALRSKHENASPALPPVNTSKGEDVSMTETARTTALTPLAAAVMNDTMDDVDDEDDEDLYGNDTDTNDQESARHSEAQNARVQSLDDSQTMPGSQQSAVAAAPGQNGQNGPSQDALDQAMGPEVIVPDTTQKAPTDSEDEYDDDDLDNVYEPSETVTQPPAPPKPQVETNGAYLDSDDAMDTSAESSDSDSAYEPDAAIEPAQQLPEQLTPAGTRHSEGLDQQSDEADLAPELQPTRETLDPPIEPNGAATHSRHTPYESALRLFKDYRFHPEFTNTVPAGFKSLTYNHKIDPMLIVCTAELHHGQCDYPDCGYQHFHQMSLHDNDLLRLMGTERTPARNPEEEQKWKEGLQNLVKELRTTNFGKDAGLIAQRIAEYRRAFVNDPTRIVLFDD